MVAYCNDCERYVNQYCDRCGDNFGISVCEKYGCGGSMRCPFCGGANLSAKKEFGPDPYDYRKKRKEDLVSGRAGVEVQHGQTSQCPMCNFKIEINWKYCPMCGVSFQIKK